MVIVSLAHTAAINPSTASTTLTRAQVWAGLQRKVRRGQDFVPVIVDTSVVSEEKDPKTGRHVVTRDATFQEGLGPAWAWAEDAVKNGRAGMVRERCVEIYDCKVDFYQPDGSVISNTISEGTGGSDDLYMTYTFEWLHPEVGENDIAQIEEIRKKEVKLAQTAVEKSIESIRRLVTEGVIS